VREAEVADDMVVVVLDADASPTHGIRNSRTTPVGTPGAAVMDRSCGAEGRATVP
jgi:hypothetical protein